MSQSLSLFVTGRSTISERAILNLRTILETALGDDYTLEIIDVLEQPDRAEEARIVATPTLLRSSPPPKRKIIGDMSYEAAVLSGLDLVATMERKEQV